MRRFEEDFPRQEHDESEGSELPVLEPTAAQPVSPALGKSEAREPEPSAGRDAALRGHILARFEVWLDEILADEGSPEGLPAALLAELDETFDVARARALDPRCDHHRLWSDVVRLAQEVKLQGRSFGELSECVARVGDLAPRADAALEAQGKALVEARRIVEDMRAAGDERNAAAEKRAEQRGRRQALEVLLDLRDRLRRGLALANRQLQVAPPSGAMQQSGAMQRLRTLLRRRSVEAPQAVEATHALVTGYSLTLERLEEELEGLGVRAVECDGRPFDPHLMNAADVERTERVPQGTVLETFRAGYCCGEEVLRTAQVKVARAPAAGIGALGSGTEETKL